LCRDQAESDALREAILSQTDNSVWADIGGPGDLHFARPGTLVVLNDEDVLTDVLELLETYRTALRSSKPRDRHAPDPDEVITVYYRMHATVADDLVESLPKLVRPDSWTTKQGQAGAIGKILRVASKPEVLDVLGQLGLDNGKGSPTEARKLVVARAVLVITQTRAAHDEIEQVLSRINTGDTMKAEKTGGMGGFGGGFFSVGDSLRHGGK
jgi:hypothetical protein